MTETEILSMTKSNLELIGESKDEYLSMLISSAQSQITREGITLSLDDIDDCNLVIMYASYLYSKRRTDEAMPRMLRYALNNRVFKGKVGGSSAT